MIAVIITLYIAEDDKTRFELVIFIPLINSTINMQIARIARATNAQAAAIKNVFNFLPSFDLYATTIEKLMIERNIKNSTMTKMIKREITKINEKFPVMTVEIKSFKTSVNPGRAYMIKIETMIVANPASISINAVKYFELIS